MTKLLIAFCITLLYTTSLQAQNQLPNDTIADAAAYWAKVHADLYEVGIKLENDSLKISPEARRILADSAYRAIIFPANYSWAKAAELLKQMELKKAFWFLIKLYQQDPANKQMVMQSLMPFDKSMDMDKVLISTFYTYALLDKEVCSLDNHRLMVTRPDLLEKSFHEVKEMIAIIRNNREPVAQK